MKVSLTEQTWFRGMSVTSAELPSKIPRRCDPAQFVRANRTAVQDGMLQRLIIQSLHYKEEQMY